MNSLLAGHESKERVKILLSLTNIRSESMINAINLHLVDGMQEEYVTKLSGVLGPNFNRSMKIMNEVAGKVEAIKEIDYLHLKSVK